MSRLERRPEAAERWEPLNELEQVTQRMRRLLEQTFGGFGRLARTTVDVLALFSGLMACAVVRIVAGRAKTIRCGHLLGVLDEAGVLRTPAQRRRERCLVMLGRSAVDGHAEVHRLRGQP